MKIIIESDLIIYNSENKKLCKIELQFGFSKIYKRYILLKQKSYKPYKKGKAHHYILVVKEILDYVKYPFLTCGTIGCYGKDLNITNLDIGKGKLIISTFNLNVDNIIKLEK